jgi:hypothetical protein
MADSANNTTLSFGTTISKVKSISYKDSGAKIDVTALTSTEKQYLAGIRDKEVTFDLVGTTTLSIGGTGAVTVGWADGTSTSVAKCVVTNVDVKAAVDSALEASVTIVPTP